MITMGLYLCPGEGKFCFPSSRSQGVYSVREDPQARGQAAALLPSVCTNEGGSLCLPPQPQAPSSIRWRSVEETHQVSANAPHV